MKLFAAFDRYWFAPAPAARLGVLRLLIGGFAVFYLAVRFSALMPQAHFEEQQFVPVGLAKLSAGPLPHALGLGLTILSALASVPFVLGWRYAVTGPLFALSFLWVATYRNSWGMVFHTESLLALHLLLLAASPAADAFSLDARRRSVAPEPAGSYGWAPRAMACVTVVCYVLAGIAKLKLDGLAWFEGDYLRRQIAYDNLRKIELSSDYASLGAALVPYARLFPVLAFFTLVVELGAPVALLGRRYALVWSIAAWLFHVGVIALMAITFPYQTSFVAFAPFFEVERLVPIWERASARLKLRLTASKN